jgi:nitronate monooxygenase/enoyl-[acyl-carrier protein] reductase II
MQTPLCELLDVELPLIAAPFGPWDSAALTIAVCEAGGLGSLGTAVRPLHELQAQWRAVRSGTDRPFAINHQTRPFDPDVFEASLRSDAAAISFHMGDPGELVKRAHDAGKLWLQQVMSVEQAALALERGADVLIAQGGEAGGHSGDVAALVLVPQVSELAGDVPVVAAGGIADGRGIAAAFALGAQGVVMGTRLLASEEMSIAPEWKRMIVSAKAAEWKRMIVAAKAADAIKVDAVDELLPPYNRPHWPATPRVIHTAFHDEWTGREEELRKLAPALGGAFVADVLQGGGHEVAPMAGQSAGLIDDIRPAAEIIRDAFAQAEDILSRLVRV